MGGGELGAGGGEAEVAVAGQGETHPGGRPVDGGDDGLGDAEVVGEVGVELGPHPVAGPGQVRARPRVVAAPLDVALEGPGVGPGAETPPGAGHHDDPDRARRRPPGPAGTGTRCASAPSRR